MRKRSTTRSAEEAVSPVVGVMLMLVVTIIVAAVVSAFAGGLASGEQKAPQITAETTITNTGYYYGSQFNMVITSVSEPIASNDLKIMTSWRASNGVRNATTVLPRYQEYELRDNKPGSPLGVWCRDYRVWHVQHQRT